MKKLVILLMIILVANVALSQIEYDQNHMCVVFDTETMERCIERLPSNTIVTAYLCLANPDFASIQGFECTMTIDGSIFPLDPVFPDGALNIGSGDNYIVEFDVVPVETVHILMSLEFMAFGGPIFFDLGPSVPSSGTLGCPMVAAVDEDGISSMICSWSLSDSGVLVASINFGNCSPIVDTETVSFDSIKSLYR